MAYTKQDIQDVVEKYDQGKQSVRSIAKEFGIPSPTLRHPLSGTQRHQEASNSVFSPLKYTYQKHLNNINTWAESTVVGKQLMLKCILRARREAITAQNAKAGWRRVGNGLSVWQSPS